MQLYPNALREFSARSEKKLLSISPCQFYTNAKSTTTHTYLEDLLDLQETQLWFKAGRKFCWDLIRSEQI